MGGFFCFYCVVFVLYFLFGLIFFCGFLYCFLLLIFKNYFMRKKLDAKGGGVFGIGVDGDKDDVNGVEGFDDGGDVDFRDVVGDNGMDRFGLWDEVVDEFSRGDGVLAFSSEASMHIDEFCDWYHDAMLVVDNVFDDDDVFSKLNGFSEFFDNGNMKKSLDEFFKLVDGINLWNERAFFNSFMPVLNKYFKRYGEVFRFLQSLKLRKYDTKLEDLSFKFVDILIKHLKTIFEGVQSSRVPVNIQNEIRLYVAGALNFVSSFDDMESSRHDLNDQLRRDDNWDDVTAPRVNIPDMYDDGKTPSVPGVVLKDVSKTPIVPGVAVFAKGVQSLPDEVLGIEKFLDTVLNEMSFVDFQKFVSVFLRGGYISPKLFERDYFDEWFYEFISKFSEYRIDCSLESDGVHWEFFIKEDFDSRTFNVETREVDDVVYVDGKDKGTGDVMKFSVLVTPYVVVDKGFLIGGEQGDEEVVEEGGDVDMESGVDDGDVVENRQPIYRVTSSSPTVLNGKMFAKSTVDRESFRKPALMAVVLIGGITIVGYYFVRNEGTVFATTPVNASRGVASRYAVFSEPVRKLPPVVSKETLDSGVKKRKFDVENKVYVEYMNSLQSVPLKGVISHVAENFVVEGKCEHPGCDEFKRRVFEKFLSEMRECNDDKSDFVVRFVDLHLGNIKKYHDNGEWGANIEETQRLFDALTSWIDGVSSEERALKSWGKSGKK